MLIDGVPGGGEQILRSWRAAEMFAPRPLPGPDVRENVIDVAEGNPLPWEPGGRLAGRAAGPGRTWRHQVFGGLFALSRVHRSLAGQSALFCCTVGESGMLITGPAISECAWAAGQSALGDEAAGGGDPAAWLTASSREGCLPVSPENLPAFPDGPPTGPGLACFAADLAELLGVTALLEPEGLRVRSYQVPDGARDTDGASSGGEAGGGHVAGDAGWGDPPLSGYFAADLAAIAEGLPHSAVSPPLTALLTALLTGPLTGPPDGETDRVDVRREPLVVRDGCAPDRIPPARWPSAAPLALSEQFAVNEIADPRAAALAAVHTPRGSDVTAVFSDIIAAVLAERARVLAALPSPAAAFGTALPWGSRAVAPPVAALTGFEILLASPGARVPGLAGVPALAGVGDLWLDEAATADYFPSTARLAGGAESWAMIRAHLDGAESCRAFVDRFWHGTVRGADALFRAGISMREALRDSPAAAWPAAVARLRSALAAVRAHSAERSRVSAAVTQLSALEQACEDAYSSLEDAQERLASLTEREAGAREELIAAEERRRVTWENLRAHQADKPGLVVAVSTGLRAGRDWYTAHAALRADFDEAVRRRDAALASVQGLRAELAAARNTIARSRESAGRIAAEMDRLHAPVAAARQRWGDRVPEGPSHAETEDAALIGLRESSAPWADPEFTRARTELFFAALALHKSFVRANAGTFEANLAAWTDIVSGAERPPPAVALAAWQSFFLIVPVVSTSFASLGSLLAGLGHGSLGWLLAADADAIPPRHVAGALWRTRHAVLAGSLAPAAHRGEAGTEDSALHLAARAARFGTSLPDGTWAGLPLYPRSSPGADPAECDTAESGTADSGTADSGAVPASEGETLRTALSDLRQRARSRSPTRTA